MLFSLGEAPNQFQGRAIAEKAGSEPLRAITLHAHQFVQQVSIETNGKKTGNRRRKLVPKFLVETEIKADGRLSEDLETKKFRLPGNAVTGLESDILGSHIGVPFRGRVVAGKPARTHERDKSHCSRVRVFRSGRDFDQHAGADLVPLTGYGEITASRKHVIDSGNLPADLKRVVPLGRIDVTHLHVRVIQGSENIAGQARVAKRS